MCGCAGFVWRDGESEQHTARDAQHADGGGHGGQSGHVSDDAGRGAHLAAVGRRHAAHAGRRVQWRGGGQRPVPHTWGICDTQ